MKKYLLFFLILILSATVCSQLRLGDEILLSKKIDLLKGKRLGVVSNAVSKLPNGTHIIDSLLTLGYNVTAVFSPEHGFSSAVSAGEKIKNQTYKQTDIPVYSLYGEINKPTDSMLSKIDLMIYEIQDVGARFYTYISTMVNVMEASAANNKGLLILDRPNPLGGILTDGPVLEPAFKSFVGIIPIPVAYGMTCGELAEMVKGENHAAGMERLSLNVIKMENYKRSAFYDELNLEWINPSPNIPDFNTALIYPGTCLFEATNLSEGRGTEKPFLTIGAPFISKEKVIAELSKMELKGIEVSGIDFTPVSIASKAVKPKHQDAECHGIRITVKNKRAVMPVELGIKLLCAFYYTHSEKVTLKKASLERLSGTDKLYKQLIAKTPPEEIIRSWQNDITEFRKKQTKYLIYN